MIGPNTYNHSLAVNVTVNGSPMLVVRPLNKCSTSPPCMIRTAGQEGSVCLLCLAACQGSKFSPPCRFHGARDSVKGIKDAASWRMARLLLVLGRRGGGSTSVHMAAGTKQVSWCMRPLSSLFLLSSQAAVRGACAISVTKIPPVVTRGVRYSNIRQS